MGRIVVVGSSNTDMVLRCDRLPRPGETVMGLDFMTAGGGKGANQAIAAARLGAHLTFVARLGRDGLGDQALAAYRAEGIACDFITRDEHAASGVALIMVDAHAENVIGVGLGANLALRPEHVEQAEGEIARADVLLVQLEIPLESVEAAVRLARKHDVPVILNPAPARELPAGLLRDVLLTPNETEAEILSGVDTRTPAGLAGAAARLLAQGARQVVITLGARGVLLAAPGRVEQAPAFRVQAVDTTAAGDAFNGGLACALARGDAMPEAVRFAMAAAALSVTRMGAQPSLPTGAEVEAFLSDATDAHG